ncbi:hypothetical protein ACU8KH_00405 [Lachancea thermotolerans]
MGETHTKISVLAFKTVRSQVHQIVWTMVKAVRNDVMNRSLIGMDLSFNITEIRDVVLLGFSCTTKNCDISVALVSSKGKKLNASPMLKISRFEFQDLQQLQAALLG